MIYFTYVRASMSFSELPPEAVVPQRLRTSRRSFGRTP